MLQLISKMSNSILSNLDVENLLNSSITLIYQNFHYLRVSIYLVDNNVKTIKRYSITENGLEYLPDYSFTNDYDLVHWVLEHKEKLAINDFSTESNFARLNHDLQIKSEFALPLNSGSNNFGVLDLCSENTDDYPPSVIEAFQVLADNIALGIRNAKLFTLEEVIRQVSQSFIAIISDISVEMSPEEVINRILLEIEGFIPYAACALWLFENSTADSGLEQFISPARLAGISLSYDLKKSSQQAQDDITAKVKSIMLQNENDSGRLFSQFPWLAEITEQNQPIIRDADTILEPLGQALTFATPYSVSGIPLKINDKCIGFIVLILNPPGVYGADLKTIASTISIYSTLAIEKFRLITTAHEQSWMAEVLSQINRISQSYSTVPELLESISRFLVEIAGVHACSFYVWDDSTQVFYPQTSYGFDAEQQSRLDAWGMISDSIPAYFELTTSNKPVVLSEYSLTGEFIDLLFPGFDFQNNLLVFFPMVYQDKIIGTVLIDFSGSRLNQHSYQHIWEDMFSVIQEVLLNVAGSMENLLVLKTSEEEAYISVALLQVAQAVVSLTELDEILGLIVRITPILVGVKRCAIYLWDSTSQRFTLSQNYGFSKIDLVYEDNQIKADDFPLLNTIFELNQVAYCDVSTDDSPNNWTEISSTTLRYIENTFPVTDGPSEIKLDPSMLQSNARLLIGFPLSVKGEVFGVMLIEEDELVKGSFSPHIREKRIEIVNGITQQAAIAIQNEFLQQEIVNSERMERELQLARDIQKAFLPHQIPDIPGLDIDIRWKPAREVGGDFYDILLHDDKNVGFVIADVADKGMPAALFMTLIRTLIRAAAREYTSPAEVLRQVNELLLEDAQNGMFVTVFYCVLSLEDGKMIYANAGHNPPVVKYKRSRNYVELTRTAMALGLFPDIEIGEREITLTPGDGMVLYTDGVTEAFSVDEEMFGTQNLLEIIQDHPFHSSTEILDDIENEVYRFIGRAELSDDLTLCGIVFRHTF